MKRFQLCLLAVFVLFVSTCVAASAMANTHGAKPTSAVNKDYRRVPGNTGVQGRIEEFELRHAGLQKGSVAEESSKAKSKDKGEAKGSKAGSKPAEDTTKAPDAGTTKPPSDGGATSQSPSKSAEGGSNTDGQATVKAGALFFILSVGTVLTIFL